MINLIKDAQKLFKQLKKLKQLEAVTHKQILGEPSYDAVRGEESVHYETTDNVSAYITGYLVKEINETVLITDSKCIILKESIPVQPVIGDIILRATGTYHVISTLADPGNPAIELQLRSA